MRMPGRAVPSAGAGAGADTDSRASVDGAHATEGIGGRQTAPSRSRLLTVSSSRSINRAHTASGGDSVGSGDSGGNDGSDGNDNGGINYGSHHGIAMIDLAARRESDCSSGVTIAASTTSSMYRYANNKWTKYICITTRSS